MGKKPEIVPQEHPLHFARESLQRNGLHAVECLKGLQASLPKKIVQTFLVLCSKDSFASSFPNHEAASSGAWSVHLGGVSVRLARLTAALPVLSQSRN
jgi:hypothetical protein